MTTLPEKPTKGKSFDCMAFKRAAQAEIYQQIKGMTHEQEIAYFRKAAANGPLAKFWSRSTASAAPNPADHPVPRRRSA